MTTERLTPEQAAKLTDRAERIAWLAHALRDYAAEDFFAIAEYANSYSGVFDWAQTFYLDDLDDYGFSASDVVRAVVCGNVRNVVNPMRFNAYGNLETVDDATMEEDQGSYADDVAEYVVDNVGYSGDVDHLLFYQEEQDVLDAWEEMEDAEYWAKVNARKH